MRRATLTLKRLPERDESHAQIVEALAVPTPAGLFGLKGADPANPDPERTEQ